MSFKFNLKQFEKDMETIVDALREPGYMKQFGEYAADRIVKRTLLGRGVENRGDASEPLDALKASTKSSRKRLKEKGKLSPLTSPGKSNLTQTGQMLSHVDVKAKQSSATIYLSGNRRESNLTNADVAGFVSEKRPFLNLSKAELNGLNRFIRETLEKIVKSILT